MGIGDRQGDEMNDMELAIGRGIDKINRRRMDGGGTDIMRV
jgi:hypothetical protein